MLRLFLRNDPANAIVLLGLMLLIKVPYFFMDGLYSENQLLNMLLGNKLASGGLMYVDIWDDCGWLSVQLFKLGAYFGPRPWLFYKISGFILILFQGLYFNNFLNNREVFKDKNYLFAFFYILGSLVIFNLAELSPQLLGLTFLLLAICEMIALFEEDKAFHRLLYIGLLLALASLAHLEYALFIFPFLLFCFLYAKTPNSVIPLILVGFLFPFVMLILYYHHLGHLDLLFHNYFFSSRFFNFSNGYHLFYIVVLFAVWIFFSLLIIPFSKIFYGVSNFQGNSIQFIIWITAFSILFLVISRNKVAHDFIILLLPFAFFTSQLPVSMPKKWLNNMVFYLFGILCIASHFWITLNLLPGFMSDYHAAYYQKHSEEKYIGEKVWLVNQPIFAYQNNELGAPYLRKTLSVRHLERTNEFATIASINTLLARELPTKVVDNDNIFSKIIYHIPKMEKKYENQGNGVYVKK